MLFAPQMIPCLSPVLFIQVPYLWVLHQLNFNRLNDLIWTLAVNSLTKWALQWSSGSIQVCGDMAPASCRPKPLGSQVLFQHFLGGSLTFLALSKILVLPNPCHEIRQSAWSGSCFKAHGCPSTTCLFLCHGRLRSYFLSAVRIAA